MRKIAVALITVLALGTGVAFAQDMDLGVDDTTQYAGVGLGYPWVTVYYGLEDMVGEGADLRLRLQSFFYTVGVGADVLFDVVEIEDQPITVYAGGGPGFNYYFSGIFDINVTGVVGGNYRFSDDMSGFVETGVGVGYVSTPLGGFISPAFRGALGVNFHF